MDAMENRIMDRSCTASGYYASNHMACDSSLDLHTRTPHRHPLYCPCVSGHSHLGQHHGYGHCSCHCMCLRQHHGHGYYPDFLVSSKYAPQVTSPLHITHQRGGAIGPTSAPRTVSSSRITHQRRGATKSRSVPSPLSFIHQRERAIESRSFPLAPQVTSPLSMRGPAREPTNAPLATSPLGIVHQRGGAIEPSNTPQVTTPLGPAMEPTNAPLATSPLGIVHQRGGAIEPSNATTTPSHKQTEIRLKSWFIRIVRGGMVLVLGVRDSSEALLWRSGPISHRISPSVVTTRSGSVYHLVGGLDRKEMSHYQGGDDLPMSDALVARFHYGFPRNWKELVQALDAESVKRESVEIDMKPDMKPELLGLKTPQSCMRIPHGIRNRVPHPRPPHPRPQQPRKLSSQCPLVSDEKIFRPAQSSHSIERPLAKKRFDFCKDKPICPITAKRGTMKRKRQVREAMACLDEGCSDDIFESTPLKRRRKVIQIDDSDSESDSENSLENGDLETPTDNWRVKLGAPLPLTPQPSIVASPSFHKVSQRERNAADKVMFNISKSKTNVKHFKSKSKVVGTSLKNKGYGYQVREEDLFSIETGEKVVLIALDDDSDDDID